VRRVRVLIADDNEDYRLLLGRFVSVPLDIQVVASAADGQQAVELAETTGPDVALVDIVMPRLDGLEVTRRMKAMSEGPRVVVLTAHQSEDNRQLALAAGADAFLPKSRVDGRLLEAIRELAGDLDRGSRLGPDLGAQPEA
jgi:CheY-like chemotaxis protein